MKKLLLISFLYLLLSIICLTVFSQPGVGISFLFSQSAGVNTFPTPGSTSQIISPSSQDDSTFLFAPPSMNIPFAGESFQKVVISTNGWLALLPDSINTIPASLSAGGSLNSNQLSNYTGGFPILAPFWDDISATTITYNYYSGQLWVRWASKIDKTNPTAAILYWLSIDEATGVINYYYSNNVYFITGIPSASIGLAGKNTGDYYSYDPVSGNTWADSTIETNNISTRPVNLTYTFTPYNPISGVSDDMSSNDINFSISAFPNPASDEVNVSFKSEKNKIYSIKILNLLGKVVIDEKINAHLGINSKRIDLKNISKGIYLVRAEADGKFSKTVRLQLE